jgi:hypothetical protein
LQRAGDRPPRIAAHDQLARGGNRGDEFGDSLVVSVQSRLTTIAAVGAVAATAVLLLPYAGWAAFATALNAEIVRLNPSA